MEPTVVRIDDLDDPRIAAYRALKERELAEHGHRFIAEGEYIVRRLLASRFQAESILLTERKLAELRPAIPAHVPILVTSDQRLRQIIGFRFHSGVLACGLRATGPTLDDVVPRTGRCLLVVLPEVTSHENLGSLIRISAAFGADAIILGRRCCDPFWRRSIRVSMGTVFRLPIVRSDDLHAELVRLRQQDAIELIATVLDDSAEPLAEAPRPPRLALLFGNEAQGLDADVVALCGRRVTIPMMLGTDSLNVAVAAGIFLYHFTQRNESP